MNSGLKTDFRPQDLEEFNMAESTLGQIIARGLLLIPLV